MFRLLLDRLYNRAKRQDGGHGDQKSERQIDGLETAAVLGAQYGVSPRAVERAGKFAEEAELVPEMKRAG